MAAGIELVWFIVGVALGGLISMLSETEWVKKQRVIRHNNKWRAERQKEINADNTNEWEVRVQFNDRPDILSIFVEPWPKTHGGTIGFYHDVYGLGDQFPIDTPLDDIMKSRARWVDWCTVKNAKRKSGQKVSGKSRNGTQDDERL